MKNPFRKLPRRRNFGCPLSLALFVALLTLFLGAPSLFAQGGGGVDESGGPLVTIDMEPVCDDGTTVWAVVMTIVGTSSSTLIRYLDAQGNPYTLTGTPTVGSCGGGGGGGSGPDYTTNVLALCDSGTPFYRVGVYTNNSPIAAASFDFALDLSTAYTVSGTVYTGPCYTTATAGLARITTSTSGTIAAGAFSYEICNRGTIDGLVTIGGAATTLIPGSCTSYRASYNPATRQYRVAPAITYNASGTSFVVITEN